MAGSFHRSPRHCVLLRKEHELHLTDYMTDFHFRMRNSLIELHKVESIIRMLLFVKVPKLQSTFSRLKELFATLRGHCGTKFRVV